MLHLERLQALHAVSTFGSVTGAAAALHLTPSAVSQQLGKLQRDVGQRLIEPYGRGVRLTPAGVLLARRAHAILSEVESAESELWLLAHPESRHLRRVAAVYGHLARSISLP